MAENEDMGYFMPETGTNLWSDAMVIPKNAKNPDLAHAFINYASDYDGAYDNSSYVGYTSANQEVMDTLSGEGGDYEASTHTFRGQIMRTMRCLFIMKTPKRSSVICGAA